MKLIHLLRRGAQGYAASFGIMALIAAGHLGSHSASKNAPTHLSLTSLKMSFAERTKDTCAPTSPIETKLAFASRPEMGAPNELVFDVAAFEPGPNAEIYFDIPNQMRVLGGNIRQSASLTKEKAYRFKLPVQVNHTGEFEIMVSAICGEPDYRFGRRMHLYVRATEAGIEVSDQEEFIRPIVEVPAPSSEAIAPIYEPKEGDVAPGIALPWRGTMTHDPKGRVLDTKHEGEPGPSATVTLNGNFYYYRDDGNYHGCYGGRVIAWDNDTFSADDYLGDSICQWTGAYSITFDNNSDDFLEGGTADVYYEFRTENGVTNVTNGSGTVYTGSTGIEYSNIGGGTYTRNWYYNNGTAYERRYQVLDDFTSAWSHGYYDLGHSVHFTSCRFENGWTNGSYYQTGSNTVWIHGEHYASPDVIMHEYGHSYHDSINADSYWPPGAGGAHTLTGHFNQGLALTEGYATYFACSAQGDEGWYDDRSAFNTIHFDCEANWDGNGSANGNSDNASNAPLYGYDTESAVLSLLLDIDDANADSYDWCTFGDNEIQDVMDGINHPGIQSFYDGWKSRGWGYHPKINGEMHVHGMNQGSANSFLGLYSGVSLYGGTWYYGGYGRGSYDVKNYGSINYDLDQCYVWLRGPSNEDIGQFGGDGNGAVIAPGATRSVWETSDQTGYNPSSPNYISGLYSVTAGHYQPGGVWRLFEPAEAGTDRQVYVNVVRDTDAPDYCDVVDDGLCQNSSTTLHIVANAADYDSSIKGYWTRVGTSAGAGDEQDWVFHAANNQTTFDYTITGLSMNANTTYYVTVVARNIENYDTYAYTDGIIAWDATPPGAVNVTDDGVWTSNLTQLHFTATTTENDGCIMGYWTRIGTAPNAGDEQDWIFHATGDVNIFEHTLTGLSMTPGETYYITVVARNMSGLDTWGYSNGIIAGRPITGRVALQNWGASLAGMPIRLEIRNVGGGAALEVHNTTIDGSGNYTVYTGLAVGNRDFYCKSTHWLQRIRSNVSVPAGGATGVNFSLRNGDSDPDNEVNIVDIGIIAAAFGKALGEAGYNWWADLDGDDEVTIVDIGIANAAFGSNGDE